MENYKSNAVLGRGDWVVAEADESDRSFLNLKPIVSIVTNIDPEHMESYGSFDDVKQSFLKFLNTPFHGVGIGCFDHDVVRDLLKKTQSPVISYGLTGGDLEADHIRFTSEGMVFNVKNHIFPKFTSLIEDMFIPLMGLHNVQNTLAVMAFCMWIGVDDYRIQQAFKTFKGVKRRFNILKNSKDLVIIDDYAHHPVEIHAVIDTTKASIRIAA
jgi:UDP-N-acetylmuramate--alanine ligase